MNDILLKDGDIAFANGDFLIGDTTNQNIGLIVISSPGEFRQHPTCGCGLIKLVNAKGIELSPLIREQLVADGLTIDQLVAKSPNSIQIKAFYGNS